MPKNVLISCGPVPARLDSVKFITNRFKGGLAFKTANFLANRGHNVTMVTWRHTQIPDYISDRKDITHLVIDDVMHYYDLISERATEFDAFVLAAAVANLMPAEPIQGKFPSHLYSEGDEFNIKFKIAPRIIDQVKKLNPRCCLIGYKLFDAASDEDLIEIARHTQADSKANIIFANTPKDAKTRKLAITPDGTAFECDFAQHLELIDRAIRQDYFRTVVRPVGEDVSNDPNVRKAMALVKMFEQTFNGHGTVAVRAGVQGMVTTSRGHKEDPVLIRGINFQDYMIYTTGKATLNAPAMFHAAMFPENERHIAIHRHDDDPLFDKAPCDKTPFEPVPDKLVTIGHYLFPGTAEEYDKIVEHMTERTNSLKLFKHGYIKRCPIIPVDWNRYYELFPKKYFGIPYKFKQVIAHETSMSQNTLEVGCNSHTDATFAYDKFVKADNAENLTWDQVENKFFDFIYVKNAIAYLTRDEIEVLVKNCTHFMANAFTCAPDEKISENEAAVKCGDIIYHMLRLPDDSVIEHSFYAHDKEFYESLGLTTEAYGNNGKSLLVYK